MAEQKDKDQKTELPTEKRKKENREKGIVARSQTLVSWVTVLMATVIAPPLLGRVMGNLRNGVAAVNDVAAEPSVGQLATSISVTARETMLAFIPMLLLVTAIAIVGSFAQVGFLLTLGPLKPKWERVSPKAGVKRMLSPKKVWETGKQVLLVAVTVLIAAPAVISTAQMLAGSSWDLHSAASETGQVILMTVQVIAAIGVAAGVADFAWEKYRNKKDSMMTKEEVKEERKQTDGDPHVKAKQQSLRMAMGRNRMLAAVADADVVITNPTHFAVALSYVPSRGAPKVVARGADGMAAKIRERARGAGVPMVEAPPLARALHAACRVDEEIPKELFQAVAMVLAFVQRIGRARLSEQPMSVPVVDTWTARGFDPDEHQRAARRRRRRRVPGNAHIGVLTAEGT